MYARKESGVMQMRGLILLLMIVYVISPVDAYPGPIDDIIVIVLGEMLRRHLEKRKREEERDRNRVIIQVVPETEEDER